MELAAGPHPLLQETELQNRLGWKEYLKNIQSNRIPAVALSSLHLSFRYLYKLMRSSLSPLSSRLNSSLVFLVALC